MKELNIMEATVMTSPNPLTLICSQNEDGTTNLAPICFVSYLSFNPPMIGFAAGKQSHTGKRVRETGKVIVTVPGEGLTQTVMACGSSTGATSHKVEENHIEMISVDGSEIQIPGDTRLAMVATLQQSVEVGDHILHICQVDKFLGYENKRDSMLGTALAEWPRLWKAEAENDWGDSNGGMHQISDSKEVFTKMEKNPQHQYLFLTKRPAEIDFSTHLDNAWFGVTVTSCKEKNRITTLREHIRGRHYHVTFEPMFDDIGQIDLAGIEWVVIGTEPGGRKGKSVSKPEWV